MASGTKGEGKSPESLSDKREWMSLTLRVLCNQLALPRVPPDGSGEEGEPSVHCSDGGQAKHGHASPTMPPMIKIIDNDGEMWA